MQLVKQQAKTKSNLKKFSKNPDVSRFQISLELLPTFLTHARVTYTLAVGFFDGPTSDVTHSGLRVAVSRPHDGSRLLDHLEDDAAVDVARDVGVIGAHDPEMIVTKSALRKAQRIHY